MGSVIENALSPFDGTPMKMPKELAPVVGDFVGGVMQPAAAAGAYQRPDRPSGPRIAERIN
jgi:hypothetical protein